MELGNCSEDQLDQLLVRAEAEVGTWRAVEMAVIVEKRRRKSHVEDGYRSLVDWMAARADVSHETARSLCWTASRLGDAPEVVEQLSAGEISFDRAQLLARLPEPHRSGHEGYDISGLRRLVADHKRFTRKRERRAGNGYLHFGSCDELATRFWGELPGLDARILEKAVDQKADEIIPPGQKLAVAERRALALAAICQDSLYQTGSSEESGPVDVMVIVDAETAVETKTEKGVRVLAGPRVGPGTPRRDPLSCADRPDRDQRGRETARFETSFPDRGPEAPASCPPSGWGLHRGRLLFAIPARNPSCPSLVPRRTNR